MRAHNLKIFDAAWEAFDRHYFDRAANAAHWRDARAVYRPKAEAAKNDFELYWNVLHPMLHTVEGSHIAAVQPNPPKDAVARHEAEDSVERAKPHDSFGFAFAPTSHGLWVSDVTKGGVFDRAGVEPGSLISDMTAGPSGNGRYHAHVVVAAPQPQVLDYDYVPDPPTSPNASRRLTSGRLLLRFDGFDRDTAKWLARELAAAPAEGVIIDLRQNLGGEIRAERVVLGALVGTGRVIGRRLLEGAWEDEVSQGKQVYQGPVAVLIGPGSNSAAEVTAAALRFQKRAVLVGAPTAGVVRESHDYALPDGGYVQVPVREVFTPDGFPMEGLGVAPDILVWPSLASIRADRDVVVEAAERALDQRTPAS